MKMTTLLLLATCLQVSATAFSQSITFSGKNVPLETVFSAINKQSGYIVFCDYGLIKDAKKVTLHVRDASVESIMSACLRDQPLTYEIVGKTIVISRKQAGANNPGDSRLVMPPPMDITGRVTNEKGEGVPSATVAVKGTNKITVTNDNGEFELKGISSNAVLVITSVGFERMEVKLTGQSTLNVQLKLAAALNEVVVTALGIQRKAKSLTYSTEEVKGAALTAVPETNVMNSLQGKVSGLNVFRGSGGAGGSVNVVIRGSKSFGNNQPLYVIDGIPFQNNSPTQPAGIYNGAALPDAGDNLSQINSEDIESVTVLKGASASALYGSQGQNGVVLITTKKGRAGAITVDYAVNYNRDTRAYGPKLQYTYGQTAAGANYSWSTTKGSYKNIEKDFFVPGNTWTHSVALRGGDKDRNTYMSYSNTNASNIYPNSNYNKNTINIRQGNTYFGGKLTADANILFTEQHYKNPLSPGLYNNPITGLYLFPRGLDFNQFKKNYEVFNVTRNYNLQNWWNIDWIANPSGGGGDDNQQNPFWILNRDIFTQRTDKAYASLQLKYQFTDWLNLQVRGNIDKEYRTLESKLSSGTQTVLADPLGKYKLFKYDNQQVYGDAILSFNKKINDLGVGALVGTSLQNIDNYSQHFEGPLVLANVFTLANIRYANLTTEEHQYRKRKEAVFGGLNLSYKDMLYLDATARNDWSSALAYPVGGLPLPTKSYFYPSVGLSAIVNEMAQLPEAISLWKLRASYAVVGNDIDSYQTYPYSYFSYNQNGVVAGSNGPYPLTALKPERSNSLEFGTELRLKNDVVFVDFTWFKINTKDQLVTFKAGSGQTFNNYLINAGNIENKGFELSVGAIPVKSRDFKWDIYATLYVNKNVVKEFNGTDNFVHAIAGADNGNMTYFGIRKGLPYPTFFGKKFVRDEKDGTILIDTGANLGKPLYTLYSADSTGLGTPLPKSIIGFRNTFTFKGRLSLSFLVDGRIGGQVMDVTQAILDEYGVSQASADARDHASTFLPVKAKYVGGGAVTSIDPKVWYGAVASRAGLAEYYMTSATNIRLRELALAYSLRPDRLMAKTNNIIKAVSIGFNARNLFFFHKKAAFDPDIAVGTTNGNQGYNAFTAPATRSFGGSIKVSF
ncbi:SusC/RagA family TonB-linked outer membrane protein [Flavitalea sp. BT771]|uniref:SusC/RagA family TonB-linked outer membrane protein n=1 Tax=Flavitalea sp. BT771 TaxID=3063329 RepID=UPI0026E2B3EA|nr:SusC/RagA family TonB-linked outer membrane protein [Flavitalea sp. BT771]MDO6435402.1 SusC/RagA family TonB-linked outer membrane protein [Flavitalea sp. BT771]MDV6224238.1 SusC/RagA family TonB-linked outer membrane protein [Flavitalea sp. BT771]